MAEKTLERSQDRGDAWAELLPRRWLEWLDWPMLGSMRRGDHVLHVEEFRDNGDLVIRAEMPGIDPDKDVEIQVRDHVLEIRAERSQSEKHEEAGGYRSEFRYGSFFRAVTLPTNAKEGDVKGVIAGSADRVIQSVREAEVSALESVRKFVDTVGSIVPDVRDDGLRRKIIDSAFKMTEQLVGVSTDLARKIVKEASDALARTAGEPEPPA